MQSFPRVTRLGVAVSLAVLLAALRPAAATTIIGKTLNDLCTEADRVFVGTVSAVQSQWTDAGQRHTETLVTFDVTESLFGVDTPQVVLRFAGGQVGDLIERVEGVPVFTPGQRVVLFARDGHYVSPLVGFDQGRFDVAGDGDEATVLAAASECIGTLAAGRPLLGESAAATTRQPLRDFVAEVRRRLAARSEGGQ